MLRAELRKWVTTRGNLGLVAGAVGVMALSAFSTTTSAEPRSLGNDLHRQPLLVLASINIGLFALILGVRSFTDEFRHGTIAWTLLTVRARERVLAAKAATAALAAAAMAIAAQVVMVAVAVAFAQVKGATLGLGASDAVAIAGLAMAASAWAAIGVMVGALVRHQVPAAVGSIIWVLVVENLAAGFLGDAGRFLPGQAAHALANASAAGDLLPAWAGAAILTGYLAALAPVAALSLSRRELLLTT